MPLGSFASANAFALGKTPIFYMRKLTVILVVFALFAAGSSAEAANAAQLAERFQQLPSVAEEDLPKMSNQRGAFRGSISNSALQGFTYVSYPFVENPGSFGFDQKGRIYVAEAHRFWLGVPDLRGANELIPGDFRAQTTADRTALYEEWSHLFPAGWFSAVSDRVIRLEDRDGNGAADHRTIFADGFNDPLDGLGFSVLAGEDNSVYFTCIPKVWKLIDADDDGVAEKREVVADGFGARVSFIGHDLHGLVWGPDGRLYFSVGDRGYHVETKEGKVFSGPGRGGIFRCEADGTGFELYCTGLRNPQELAFDDHGNLFTFDNTGDIGDVARMVYALEGSDSGWDMAHQSCSHYATSLDWGEFRPEKSLWVTEKMFETHCEDQPQWVYPPASHVARGPSGVTWLTGDSLPENLQQRFLLANYRGPSVNCTILSVKVEPAGAGFEAVSEEVVIEGVGASDVELGYDGKIYICDFGGGWSVNHNGSIQVVEAIDEQSRAAGRQVADLFELGFGNLKRADLSLLLGHSDRRVRQEAQFELARRGSDSKWELRRVARNRRATTVRRLHALWALGQIERKKKSPSAGVFTGFLGDSDPELRAHAARILGDLRLVGAKKALVKLLRDESPRVRSFTAIALGRIATPEDDKTIDALFDLVRENGAGDPEVVVRHSCLTALANLQAEKDAVDRVASESREERLMAVLVLRRLASAELAAFLNDDDALIRAEVIRAIYDTDAVDGPAGKALAALSNISSYPETIQRRVMAANFRIGSIPSATGLLGIAEDSSLAASVRIAGLEGLRRWTTPPVTDSVQGRYRPVVETERSAEALATGIGAQLKSYLSREKDPKLLALGLRLASETGVQLDPDLLRAQSRNKGLDSGVRVATLDSLAKRFGKETVPLVKELLQDEDELVRAAALAHAFALKADVRQLGLDAVAKEELPVARAALAGLGETALGDLKKLWKQRGKGLRKALWLDTFLALQTAGAAEAARFSENPTNVFGLSEFGGDATLGKFVFENHGACLQCHTIKGNGGVQGPPLDGAALRLTRAQILESIYAPNAVITSGYTSVIATMKDDNLIMGRLTKEDKERLWIIAPDGAKHVLERSKIAELTPPVSAMPPLGAALPPHDLRNLVAYISSLKKKPANKAAEGH
jgi:quinoprotein glucose dehydrogenase